MKKCGIKLNILLGQKKSQMIMVITTWNLKISIDDNLAKPKKRYLLDLFLIIKMNTISSFFRRIFLWI